MGFLADKVHRGIEAASLIAAHAADLRASVALTSCYAAILRSATDGSEVTARLRINRAIFPFRLRKCDIFTLAEVLYEKQYRIHSPLPRRPIILDAGANIGVASAWFLANYPGAVVHCFEPQSENFRLLSANLGSRDDVVLHRVAVGACAGEATLRLASHSAEHSLVSDGSGTVTETVPVLRLGDYLEARSISHVDLLKLDVEGSELDALLGLGVHLERVRVIVGEVHERFVDQDRFYDVLDRAGFEVLHRRRPLKGNADAVHHFEAVRPSQPT